MELHPSLKEKEKEVPKEQSKATSKPKLFFDVEEVVEPGNKPKPVRHHGILEPVVRNEDIGSFDSSSNNSDEIVYDPEGSSNSPLPKPSGISTRTRSKLTPTTIMPIVNKTTASRISNLNKLICLISTVILFMLYAPVHLNLNSELNISTASYFEKQLEEMNLGSKENKAYAKKVQSLTRESLVQLKYIHAIDSQAIKEENEDFDSELWDVKLVEAYRQCKKGAQVKCRWNDPINLQLGLIYLH